jgi:hypothetical protein
MSSQINLREIIKEEYKKCAASPIYFMKKYCYIQHPQRGKILFHLYPFQEKTLQDLFEHDYNIILKSRQLGISTLTAGYALWLMLFKSDTNVLVIATKQDVAKNLVTKVRTMYDNLPSWLRGSEKPTANNKLSLELENGSKIKAVSSAGDSGRSEALSLLIIDEVAFIDDNKVQPIWASSQQTLATGGKAILLSTPNGTENFFHKMWVDAEENPRTKFNTIRLKWDVHPERDITWREEQNELLGPRLAAQECDCDFSTSGNTVVQMDVIDWYLQTHCKEPLEKRGIDGNYWIWAYPDASKNYIVSCDVARGDGSDNSTIQVFEAESLEQVAEYKGQLGTKDFGNMAVAVATDYNDALLVIENSNIGWAAIQPAIDRNYKNLFHSTRNEDVLVDPMKHIKRGLDLRDNSDMIPGFTNSTKTRPLMISKFELYLRERAVIVRSTRLMTEVKVFIWKNGKPQAQSGHNDDLVLAACIGIWVRDTALHLRQVGLELNKQMLNSFTRVGGVYTPSMNMPLGDPWKWKPHPNRPDEDLGWLIR